MRLILSLLTLPFLTMPSLAADGSTPDGPSTLVVAQLVTGTAEQKLQKLLRPHAYYGGHVTDDIRAATGDPNIQVIDRRSRWGEIYSCNYVYLQGSGRGRTLVCD